MRGRLVPQTAGGKIHSAMQIDDLARWYEGRTDDDLLRLELDSEQLEPEANIALKNELAKRGIGSERLHEFRILEQHRRDELRRDPGRLFLLSRVGVGRLRFGKADYFYSAESKMERFRTTVFVVLFWLPLIPTGTYLIERRRKFLTNQFRVLARLPLDWGQIARVWMVAVLLVATLTAIVVLLILRAS